MRVNAPRFGEVSLNLCKADISFAIVCHSREPPVTEAESRPLLYIICFHLYFYLVGFPVLLPVTLREQGRESLSEHRLQ
jgi:hypothetical protein